MSVIDRILELPDNQEMDCYAANGAGYLGPTEHVNDLKTLARNHRDLLEAAKAFFASGGSKKQKDALWSAIKQAETV